MFYVSILVILLLLIGIVLATKAHSRVHIVFLVALVFLGIIASPSATPYVIPVRRLSGEASHSWSEFLDKKNSITIGMSPTEVVRMLGDLRNLRTAVFVCRQGHRAEHCYLIEAKIVCLTCKRPVRNISQHWGYIYNPNSWFYFTYYAIGISFDSSYRSVTSVSLHDF
jgi:hypothetical protein